MMRRRPSTTVVSFPSACMLSRVLAFAIAFSVTLRLRLASWDLNVAIASSRSRWVYQTSRIGILAKSRIAVR